MKSSHLSIRPQSGGLLPYAVLATGLIAALMTLPGCGGGGANNISGIDNAGSSSAGGVVNNRGTLALTVVWPARPPSGSRLIPAASNSIRATLTTGSGSSQTTLGTQLLTRPASGNQATVTFTGLQAGSATLSAVAFPNADGTGVGQASGSAPATISAGQTTSVTVTMASTIDHLEIAPANPTVAQQAQVALTMTARDAQGNIVLTPPQNVHWSSDHTNFVTIDSATGLATGAAVGASTVSVTESESNKTTSTTVTVAASTPSPSPTPSPTPTPTPSPTPSPGSITEFAFVSSDANPGGTNYVDIFGVRSDGSVAPLPGAAALPGKMQPQDAVTDSTGKYLYVTDGTNPDIAQFAIGPGGVLTPLSPATVPYDEPDGHILSHLVADPRGRAMYLYGVGGIDQFRINANGTLTPFSPASYLPPFESSVEGGVLDEVVMLQPDKNGNFVYAGNAGSGTVSQYSVNADGSLAPLTPQFITVDPAGVRSVAVDPVGRSVFVQSVQSSGDARIYQCAINSDGTLTLRPTPPIDLPHFLDVFRLQAEPTGHFVYLGTTNGTSVPSGTVEIPVLANGTLGTFTVDSNLSIADDIVKTFSFDTSKKFAYDRHHVYGVQSDGRLVVIGSYDWAGLSAANGPPAGVPAGP